MTPKIVIRRGPMACRRVVIGDMDQNQPALLRRGGKYFLQHASASLSIECIGEAKGEADYLADLTQVAITGAEEIIAKTFTLLQISPLLIQPCRPYDTDKKKWLTEIEFRIEFEKRWFTLPNAVQLSSYAADVSMEDEVGQLVHRYLEGSS